MNKIDKLEDKPHQERERNDRGPPKRKYFNDTTQLIYKY